MKLGERLLVFHHSRPALGFVTYLGDNGKWLPSASLLEENNPRVAGIVLDPKKQKQLPQFLAAHGDWCSIEETFT